MKKRFHCALAVSLLTLFFLPLNNLSLAEAVSDGKKVASFSDVTEENPYYEAIYYLQEKGVISGYSDGAFKPDQTVKKSEFLKMLLLNGGYDPEEEENNEKSIFVDVPEGAWFTGYVNKAVALDLLDYSGDSPYFYPEKEISRVEALKIAFNFGSIPTPPILDEEDWPLTFKDARYNSWFAPLVLKCEEIGLLKPYSTSYFGPYRKLTRGETAYLIYNLDLFLNPAEIAETWAEMEETAETEVSEEIYQIPGIEIFADVWDRITNDFYLEENESIDQTALMYQAIHGLVNSLGDEYTVFQEPEEAEAFAETLNGEFEGIGVTIMLEEGKAEIVNFVNDSPAEKMGLRVKDIITAVDGVSIEGLSLDEVASMIRGEAGTSVTLTVEREGQNQPLEFTVIRATVSLTYLAGEILEEDIFYLDLNIFGELSFIDFTQTLNELFAQNSNPQGIILDLRNNPGGYLNTTASILGHYLPQGEIVIQLKYPGNVYYQELSTGDGELASYPTVVLVNEASASASEIVALTLQETGLAKIIGKTTYGKGSVQELVYYDDESSLKITIAEWVSPKGTSVNGVGVVPDLEVEIEDADYAAGLDPQLDQALEELK